MEIMREKEQVLDAYATDLCGRPLRYRLLRNERGYVIEARYGDDSAAVFAGNDLFGAASAYRKIVRGAVTPCTLADVLADLLAAAAGI